VRAGNRSWLAGELLTGCAPATAASGGEFLSGRVGDRYPPDYHSDPHQRLRQEAPYLGRLERRLYPGGWRAESSVSPAPTGWLRSLVIAFHGHSSTAALFEQLTRFSTLADADHFIAVFPQGAVGPDGRTGWNTNRAKDPSVNELLFISDLLSRLQSQLCVDPTRIYAAGFSNGGGFTAVLACRFADRIAAFASVSGEYYPQPGGCDPARPVPILEIHGTADVTVPYLGSRRLHYPSVSAWVSGWAQRDGCRAGPSTFYRQGYVTGQDWTKCRGSGEVVQYTVLSGWHVWPDSSSRRPLPLPDAHFAATQVIWSFFAHRSLRLP
jgi:polyhydroxybutyrate depolymerase